MLPPIVYTSRDLYDQELHQVLRTQWNHVGRATRVAAPGDYFTTVLFGEALIVVKGHDGKVRALSNACRHRCSKVAEGSGHKNSFTCPYHAWSYNLDGGLRGAPMMDGVEGFDPANISLPEFPVEIWNGFIFVNLDFDAQPLSPLLTELTDQLAAYNMEDWEEFEFREHQACWNWKLSMENFTEAYHHKPVHQATIADIVPREKVIYQDTNTHYSFLIMPNEPSPKPPLFPAVDGISEQFANASLVVNIYPTFHLLVLPGLVLVLYIDPQSVDTHLMRWTLLVPRGSQDTPDFEDRLRRVSRQLNAFVQEDIDLLEKVKDVLGTQHFTPGRYNLQEKAVRQMHLWWLDRMDGVL